MPAIVTPEAIRAFLTGGFGVVAGCVLVGTVSVEDVSVVVESVLVVVGGGGGESASAYAAATPDTPRASRSTRSAARFTAGV
jgi:pyruvate/2-oxoglutarate dehydrogenase complex dihydrolipoamide acyltransferase (E2) component